MGLQRLLPGRVCSGVDFDWPKGFPNAPADVRQFLVGAAVQGVRRRAKVLMIDLSSGYTLVIHLKMTGQLVFRGESDFGAGHPSASLVGALPDASTRVVFGFADGSHLYFNDQRKFGWIRLLPTNQVEELDFLRRVGPEPLAADFTWQQFKDRLLRRKNSRIKAVLLDQTVVAGVGNIYADESLWGARLHPETAVKTMSDAQFRELFTSLRDVMNTSIAKGGSTDKNYVNAEGGRGNYLASAGVFRRQGQPCQRCGTPIAKTRSAGRGTHYCPQCQLL